MNKPYDMICKKMSCSMSYQACINRQKLDPGSKTVFFATRMECFECEQGLEVLKLYGINLPKRRRCSVCNSPDVVCRGMCKTCYNRIKGREVRERRKIENESSGV